MRVPQRNLSHVSFTVDTNCVNAKQKLQEMNRLEQWAENELILLQTTEVAQSEMLVGSNPKRIEKAYTYIFSLSEITTDQEREVMVKIEAILFPSGARNQNQKNDIEIVFNSMKYSAPLVTNDGGSKTQPGGILGNKNELRVLGIEVFSPQEAVAKVESEIRKRDQRAKQWAEFNGKALPAWVGKD
jgi:hypothetical protein